MVPSVVKAFLKIVFTQGFAILLQPILQVIVSLVFK